MRTMNLMSWRVIASLLMIVMAGQNMMAQDVAPCKPEWGADEEKAKESYSLYREFVKQENYADALPHWRYVFFNAPGGRQTTHVDGVKIFNDLIDGATDDALKEKYIDTLGMIYDVRMRCFGEKSTMGRKAVDMYKNRPADTENNLKLFEQTLAVDGNETQYFILFPYMITAEKALIKGVIDTTDIVNRYIKVVEIVDANKTDKYASKYQDMLSEINKRMAQFLTCDVMVPVLKKQYDTAPEDIENLKSIFNKLFSLQCFSDPLFKKVAPIVAEKDPNEKTFYVLGVVSQNEGNYEEAIGYFKKAMETATTNADKAKYAMGVAKLYQAKKDYPSARSYALKAAGFDPKSGEPYMLIGDLYMSSGPLCGPGTGWESQVVTWPAVDMYEKAKSVDSSVAGEANKKIANASKYFPTKGECFFRDLKSGDSYKVECWIGVTTTIRCAAE